MEYLAELGYAGLFIAAFLAATILPLGSEWLLVSLLLSGLPPLNLVMVATTANVLGSLTNYALGYWASQGVIQRWLGMSEAEFVLAERRFAKYGLLSLCFAWVPLIGDPLTVVAGVLRIPLLWFVLLVSAGKALRYLALVYVTV
jgi:membrane protein YqaA with SNARE-associated domain